jgi:tRNA(adenine34) deaminase
MAELFSDEYFMRMAFNEAKKAADLGEVPVGAVVVANNLVIAKAHNQVQLLEDVTAHAEILAITSASSYLGAKYLPDCTMYITLEPCIMCAGALKWSQIGKIVYGAADEKNGFMKFGKSLLHEKTKLEFGVMHDECSDIIKSFFRSKRRLEKS